MSEFNQLVDAELERARKLHGSIHSHHEAYAVIAEELDEYWDWVKMKASERERESMLDELVQIAAMCRKAAEDLLL